MGLNARSFYGTRRATKIIIAEAHDAIENNKNVVNIVVLQSIDGDSGSKGTVKISSVTQKKCLNQQEKSK